MLRNSVYWVHSPPFKKHVKKQNKKQVLKTSEMNRNRRGEREGGLIVGQSGGESAKSCPKTKPVAKEENPDKRHGGKSTKKSAEFYPNIQPVETEENPKKRTKKDKSTPRAPQGSQTGGGISTRDAP